MVLAIGVAVAAFFYFDLGRFLSLQGLKDNRDRPTVVHRNTFCRSRSVVRPDLCGRDGTLAFRRYNPDTGRRVTTGSSTGYGLSRIWGRRRVRHSRFSHLRYLLRDWVERKFGKWLGPVQQGFEKNAFSYLMTLRLIPLFPFFVVNLISGLTRVNVGTYVVATALGGIPGSFVYAYAGRQLRYDQFFDRHRFSRSDWGICVAGASGTCAKPVQKVVRETSMIANRTNVRCEA